MFHFTLHVPSNHIYQIVPANELLRNGILARDDLHGRSNGNAGETRPDLVSQI